MSSLPVNLPPELAHLAAFYQGNTPNINNAASAGVNTFAHHRISLRAGKWRLVDVQGNEEFVNAMHLDVIFVGANANISKMYYPGSYDPNAEENAPPTCWSDNGTAPSERVTTPVCVTCAACPMNVVGSKISAANKPVKACADSKRLAVVLADNPTGPVYELQVPPASLKNMANAFKVYTQRNTPIQTLVFRLTFSMDVDYPQIVFTAQSYITAVQTPVVQKLLGSPETIEIVGGTDKPRVAALPAPAAAGTATLPPTPAAVMYTPPTPVAAAFAPPPAPAQLQAAQSPANFTPPMIVGVQPVAGPGIPEQPAPAKRTRKKAEQPGVPLAPMVAPTMPGAPAFNPPMMPPQPAPATIAPAFVPPVFPMQQPSPVGDAPHALAPAAAVAVAPQSTSAELDSLINGLQL